MSDPALARLDRWVEDALERVRRMKRDHDAQRLKLDIDIECHPLEPQMSSRVQELTRMEEAAGRAGQVEKRRRITSKLDAQIQQECRAALNYIIELHDKRRLGLAKTQSQEREQLVKALNSHVATLHREFGLPGKPTIGRRGRDAGGERTGPKLPSVRTGRKGASETSPAGAGSGGPAEHGSGSGKEDFKDLEARLRVAIMDNWGNGERFNLNHAFSQQKARIEAEWEEYLESMQKEYANERAKLLGISPEDALHAVQQQEGTKAKRRAGGGHWLAKEKQETLIHTAPVLSPSPTGGTKVGFTPAKGKSTIGLKGGDTGAAAAAVSPAVRRRLAELSQRYDEARRQVAIQRSEALRWVTRQNTRMLMQVEAQEVERQQITRLASVAESAFASLESRIRDASATLREHISTKRSGARSGGLSPSEAGLMSGGDQPSVSTEGSARSPRMQGMPQRTPGHSTGRRASGRRMPSGGGGGGDGGHGGHETTIYTTPKQLGGFRPERRSRDGSARSSRMGGSSGSTSTSRLESLRRKRSAGATRGLRGSQSRSALRTHGSDMPARTPASSRLSGSASHSWGRRHQSAV